MFYQNSNDLVKKASATSGHVQNSNDTRGTLIKNTPIPDIGNNTVSNDTHNPTTTETSLGIGAKFQNMIQGLMDSVSLKEGNTPNGGAGIVGGSAATDIIKNTQNLADESTAQDLAHIKTKDNTMKFIEQKSPINPRITWAEVTDSTGNTKYGYITKDGIFQIWHSSASSDTNPTDSWLKTNKMTSNTSVLGCPKPEIVKKHTIAGTWDNIKPYDMVYSKSDSKRKDPLFMLVNPVVRDPKNSFKGKGLFSCDNERGNVFVSQRPSADFQISNSDDTIKNGCYIAKKVPDGFTRQTDLGDASISQCKRRAEDLGSSHFFLSPSENNNQPNQGMCWVYTHSGTPNISKDFKFDEKGTACHTVNSSEADEDKFMIKYPTTALPRLYGKTTIFSTTTLAKCPPGYNNPTANPDNNYCYAGWTSDCGEDCRRERCASNGGKWIPLDYNYNAYTCKMGDPLVDKYNQYSVSMYSLKTGGSNGVDNGYGEVGKLAYIDHNGEKHEYPPSALSYKSPASYIKLDGYDTRSAESSYGLKEAKKRNMFPILANMPNWELIIQFRLEGGNGWRPLIGNMYNDTVGDKGWGLWVSPTNNLHWSWKYNTADFDFNVENNIVYKITIINSPTTLSMVLKKVSKGTEQKQTINKPNDAIMSAEGQVTVGGWKNNKDEKFPGLIMSISVPQSSYMIDSPNSNGADIPLSNPMPVGENMTATIDKCREMCDPDEKCGGFVYTKGTGGAVGKCELKDREKMYPVGLRVADPTKQLFMKVPSINESIKDPLCKTGNGEYSTINTAEYAHYPSVGTMSSDTKCDIREMIPKKGTTKFPDVSPMISVASTQTQNTEAQIAVLQQSKMGTPTGDAESFIGIREGMGDISGGNYVSTMKNIQGDLTKIANAEYQRERLLAMTEETNKLLISESYKFILWSILAILAVMALLKLKEMFGQEDAADEGGDNGGLFAYILGLFGMGSLKTDDIEDRTGDVKEALSSAGNQLKEAGENLTTGITEGADNLVSSANEAAIGAVEGARGLADKVSETATDAVNKVGDAVGRAGSGTGGTGGTGAGTGGGRGSGRSRSPTRTSRKK
jgi:hypothetical protein